MRLRHLLGAALAALLFTACQPSASPSAEPSGAATDGTGGSIGEIPSMVGNPELEATLPQKAGEISLQSFSMSGPDFAEADVQPQFLTFIDSLGADIGDVSVAFAFGSNTDGTNTASVFAFQVAGAEAPELIDEFKASAEEKGQDPLVWNPETVGGKSVEVAEPNDDFPTPLALYATGDTRYFVSATDPGAFEEIIAGLP
jgi:hypothetical protein